MTPDELVVIMLERLAKSKVDFHVESYTTTRAAAERLLRTVGAVPEEPPKQLTSTPEHEVGYVSGSVRLPYAAPNPALASDTTQVLPIYKPKRGRRGA